MRGHGIPSPLFTGPTHAPSVSPRSYKNANPVFCLDSLPFLIYDEGGAGEKDDGYAMAGHAPLAPRGRHRRERRRGVDASFDPGLFLPSTGHGGHHSRNQSLRRPFLKASHASSPALPSPGSLRPHLNAGHAGSACVITPYRFITGIGSTLTPITARRRLLFTKTGGHLRYRGDPAGSANQAEAVHHG